MDITTRATRHERMWGSAVSDVHAANAAGGRAFHERSYDVGTAEGRRGPLPLAIQAASMAPLKALLGA
jgi:hypothetical protein